MSQMLGTKKLLLGAAAILGVTLPASAAVVVWPTVWTPIQSASGVYVDGLHNPPGATDPNYSTPPNPEYADIVGGIDSASSGPYSAGYWAADGMLIFFRIRVDNPVGASPQSVWSTLLNTDADTFVDWTIQLDLTGDNEVELAQNVSLSGGPSDNWLNVELAAGTHVGAGGVATDFYRFVNATDGSKFHQASGDDDTFVDMAFPKSLFTTTTGLAFSDTFGVALSTSASHEVLNKDLPDSNWGVIPEPTSTTLLLLGATVLLRRRSRQG